VVIRSIARRRLQQARGHGGGARFGVGSSLGPPA